MGKRGPAPGFVRKKLASNMTPEEQVARAFSMGLGAELGPKVAAYHRSLANLGLVGTSIVETVRELIAIGLAAVPGDEDELARYDRVRTIVQQRRWIFQRLNEWFNQIQAELELAAQLEPPPEKDE